MADAVKVKICGVMRREDALAADAAGADYVGVILSGGFRRSVDPGLAASLVEGLRARPVAVLVDENAAAAAELAGALGARVVQLHGDESPELAAELGRSGSWKVWKSVRVRGAGDVLRAVEEFGGRVDGILLEGYRDGVVGGGGVPLDPEALSETRGRIPGHLDVVLAGGLTPDDVGDAVARFSPSVVDVSSGVERVLGEKDPDLIRRFIEEARRAGRPTPHTPALRSGRSDR